MPLYAAAAVLIHNGKGVHPGDKITLTEEQAQALGMKVLPVGVTEPEKPFAEMFVKDLKPLAKAAGIEGYSGMDKGELVKALEGAQQAAPAKDVNADATDTGTD